MLLGEIRCNTIYYLSGKQTVTENGHEVTIKIASKTCFLVWTLKKLGKLDFLFYHINWIFPVFLMVKNDVQTWPFRKLFGAVVMVFTGKQIIMAIWWWCNVKVNTGWHYLAMKAAAFERAKKERQTHSWERV